MKRILSRLANPRILTLLLLEIALLFSIYRFFFITRYPAVFVDESWYSNAIWSDLTQGRLVDTIHEVQGYANPYANEGKWPRLGTLPYRLSFQAFGLGLWQGRIVSWGFGLLQFAVLFALGSLLFNPLTGAAAVLFLAVDPTFVENVVLIRPESLLAFTILLALTFYQLGEKRGFQAGYFLSGLLLALSLDIHTNGLLFAMALSLTHLVLTGKKVLKSRSTWLFAGGALLGAVYYVLMHPGNLIPGTSGIETWLFRPPLLDWNVASWLGSFMQEIARFRFDAFGMNLAILVPALVYALLQKKRETIFLLSLSGFTLLGLTLLSRHKGFHYAGLFYPLLFLVAASALVDLLQAKLPKSVQAFLAALVCIFVIQNIFLSGTALSASKSYDYAALGEEIRQNIPAGARVMAQPVWWLALSEYPFSSSLNLTYLHFEHQLGLAAALQAIRPDYLIVDDGQRLMLSESDAYPLRPGFDMYLLPKGEFEAFLHDHCTLRTEIEDPWHGEIQIYQVTWLD